MSDSSLLGGLVGSAVLVLLIAACSSSSSSSSPSGGDPSGTATGTTSSADTACESAKNRTIECQEGKPPETKTGDTQCRAVRCMWINFKDAQSISDKMAKRDCKEDIDDFIDISIQAHVDEPTVRDFIAACTVKAKKSPSEGGCNDPGKNSFGGHCDFYAAMTDAARTSFSKCVDKPNCTEFEACYNAIFEPCGNWR